ncbi:MAG: hypothetical protein ACM3NS_00750 [Deltaproteobacteria bacterium]
MSRHAVVPLWVPAILVLAAGGCGGPTAPRQPEVTVTPSSTGVLVGDRVTFAATIASTLDQSVSAGDIRWIVAREANQRWPAGPVGELTAAPDGRSVEWTAPAIGRYDVRVGVAGTWGAASGITVSWLPAGSPFLGTWRLKSWLLAPTAGGAPEDIAFDAGHLDVDSDGLSLSAFAPGELYYGDPYLILSYAGGRVGGQELTLCPAPGVTPCLGATWTLTDSVLTLVGPETTYDLFDSAYVTGVPTFEFVR